MNNYREEDREEFDEIFPNYSPDLFEVSIRTVSITFGNYPDLNYNHIVVDIPIKYSGKQRGVYKILFKFNGEVEDDFFIIQ
ncbi:hypothetical protein [Paenibacillus assamensis]|uniref:hypothetical protein n=1 Tax=Paenibacillus assamensis TaxID=311244 RepID=UPI00041D4A7A|nr:hypothetical protein [Paenibacillus assamensis]